MPQDKTYNGWTNYETWAVKLWIDNEEGSYNYWRERTRDAWKEAEATANFTHKEEAQIALAQALKDEHEENTPEVTGIYSDLLNAALSEVNWHEIAGAMLDDEEFEEEEADA